MRTRYSAWINGQGLQDIDDSIYIVDIVEQEPDTEIMKTERSMGSGTHFLRVNRHSLTVVIRFAVRERDPARRASVVERIRGWAQSGYLTLSDKPGRRLYVVCDRFPVGSSMRWADTLEISLTGYDVPWWEDEREETVTITPHLTSNDLYSGNGAIFMPGYVSSPANAVMTAKGNVNSFRITRGDGRVIRFENLGMESGDVFTVSHDERGIVAFAVNGESVMDKRTASSDDELTLDPGNNKVYTHGDGDYIARIYGRGRYL